MVQKLSEGIENCALLSENYNIFLNIIKNPFFLPKTRIKNRNIVKNKRYNRKYWNNNV